MIISLVLLSVALLYTKNWKLLVLQVNITALIHPFEVAVLILLEAYRYLPGILPDPKLDNYLGSYISNAFIVPAAAVTINAFSLSGYLIFGIAALFTGVDWLFTVLGIYKHFWWKSMYSGIGLSLIFFLSRGLWGRLQEKRPSLLFRLGIIFLTYAPIYNTVVFIVNQGGQLFTFQLPGVENSEKIHQGLFYMYIVISSMLVTLSAGLKLRLRYRLLGVVCLVLLNEAVGQSVFVAHTTGISAQQLILPSILTFLIVGLLFWLAQLNYLFP